jgi:hypothetical protein
VPDAHETRARDEEQARRLRVLLLDALDWCPPWRETWALLSGTTASPDPSSTSCDAGQPGKRRLLIGRTDGGRAVTLVIERTVDPATWLIVTGWDSTEPERKILEARR